jgi:hypothetical protein
MPLHRFIVAGIGCSVAFIAATELAGSTQTQPPAPAAPAVAPGAREVLGDGVDSDDLLYLRRDAHEHSDSSDSGTDVDRPEEDDDEVASAVLRELHDDVKVSASSESPFHALDAETQKVVRKLRPGSLLPHGVDRNSGEATAAAWCAFESCSANGPVHLRNGWR